MLYCTGVEQLVLFFFVWCGLEIHHDDFCVAVMETLWQVVFWWMWDVLCDGLVAG